MLKKFVLGGMVVVAALLGNACGDDGSGDSAAGPADSEVTLSSSSDDVVSGGSSSSSVTESPSTSSGQAPQSAESDGSSSSEKAVGGSSSSDGKASSSSGNVESSSSGKGEKSSSSEVAAGNSSSDVAAESSSSEKSSSSVAEYSSSVESSSSEEQSSSSVVESSSSVAESSSSSEDDVSSSSEYYKSNWAYLDKNVVYDTIIDSRDNQVYKVVTIGSQTWMAENLNYFDEQIADDAICLNNKSSNCEKYGRLYNLPITLNYDSLEIKPYDYLHSIDSMSVQGICPNGWRIPTLSEWRIVGAKWKSSTVGLSILKGSGYFVDNKTFTTSSDFWTVSATDEVRYVYVAHFDVANKYFYDNRLMRQSTFVSVRCVKDN